MREHENDGRILGDLAREWAEKARHPAMDEKARAWKAVKDQKAVRPVVLVETDRIEGIVAESRLECRDPFLRKIESRMREALQHVDDVGDDFVLEPVFWIAWDCETSDFGVRVEEKRARDDGLAYAFSHPVRDPAQVDGLHVRTRTYDRESTFAKKELLEDVFGGFLPVEIRGANRPNGGLTREAFELLGLENLLCWIYDEPEALSRLLSLIKTDFLEAVRYKEANGLLTLNNNGSLFASGSPGFCDSLPGAGFDPSCVKTGDLWLWMESQETSHVSPGHFKDVFLPPMAEICREFGLVYYGCCEPIDDRFEYIEAAIPNLRAVSVSPWNDLEKVADLLGRKYVCSRKVNPSPMSGVQPQWDLLKKDLAATFSKIKSPNLEVILRDIYSPEIGRDPGRLRAWVRMARSYI